MTAGSSQRNAAVVLLIFHLYLYGSYQLTELQVAGYPIKPTPKATYFHLLLWFGNLLFFYGLWLD